MINDGLCHDDDVELEVTTNLVSLTKDLMPLEVLNPWPIIPSSSPSCIVSFIVFCDLIFCLGWQPRWFILDDGILSYYNSQDEVGKGCKGSIKMAVCDVIGKKSPL